jgi:hypothetical protein
MRIGVLAEDVTDCDAADVLIRRIAICQDVHNVGVDRHSGKGCARLRVKARAKLRDMERNGCVAAVVLHDLDRDSTTNALNNLERLRRELNSIECPARLARLICIPVEELEAWFWSDTRTVKMVGRGKGHAHPSPHLIVKPKEKLIQLSISEGRKPRYSTNDNKELAGALDLDVCEKACASFAEFRTFVRTVVSPAGTASQTRGQSKDRKLRATQSSKAGQANKKRKPRGPFPRKR